nr:uncharacterized mitochondrial protein AtMg00810-like [Tanacetum cinerariifolium]
MENLPKVGKTNALSNPVTSNSVSIPQELKGVNNDKDVISKVVCAKCKKCLISINHDECPKVTKPKKVGTRESLATPKPRKPIFLLRWSPTGKMFDKTGKIVASSESENQSDCSNGDNACTSNTMEPKIKRFPNSTSFLDRVYNRRTKKIMETMNVSFDELSAMAFKQHSLKPELNSMTSGHITMYDDYIGGQPSATARTVPPAQEPQVRQSSTASTSIADTAPIPTNSSSHATNVLITSQDVNELNPNAMVDGNMLVNPFANPSTSAATASSSQQNWIHRTCILSTMEPKNVKESKYVLEILKKYGMESCDPVGTPMEIKDKLDLDQNGTPVDATKYRSMIGALMYLTSSRPDIVHATCLCARYQAKPTEKHLKEVKKIFRYLRGTINTGLWYTKDSGFELTEFSDANYAGCKDTF